MRLLSKRAYIYMKKSSKVKTIFHFLCKTVHVRILKRINKCSNHRCSIYLFNSLGADVFLRGGGDRSLCRRAFDMGQIPMRRADVELASQSDMLKRRRII